MHNHKRTVIWQKHRHCRHTVP